MSAVGWSHQDLFSAVRGVPFVCAEFLPDSLLYLVAKLRAQLAHAGAAEVERFLAPHVAVDLYATLDPRAATVLPSTAIPPSNATRLEDALAQIIAVKPRWERLVSVPLQFRFLTNTQVSSTNPLLPQVIYLGERAFASDVVLREVLVHELSHVWCGFLCEITDFQREGGPVDLVLPSGTGGKNTRQLVFAATFAAAAVNYYAACGAAEPTSPNAPRMTYCLSYLRGALETLDRQGTPNAMGRMIAHALREFARGFP